MSFGSQVEDWKQKGCKSFQSKKQIEPSCIYNLDMKFWWKTRLS